MSLDLGFNFTGQKKYDFVLAILDANDTVGDGTLDNTECLGEMATSNGTPFGDFDGDGDCYDLNSGTYSFTGLQVPFICPIDAGGAPLTSYTPRVVFGWNGDGVFNVSCGEPVSVPIVPVGTKINLSKITTDAANTGNTSGGFNFSVSNATPASPSLTTTAVNTPVTTELWASGPISGGAYSNDVTIAEAADPDWDVASIACTDGSGGATGSYNLATGTVTLPSGSLTLGTTLSCTFTNNATPPLPTTANLTLNKVVSGGAAGVGDFTLTATGPSILSGITGTSGDVLPGSYVLSETALAGYAGALACTGAADGDPSDGLALVAGETVICTFTNTYSVGTANFTVTKTQNSGADPVSAAGAIGWAITVENTGTVALTAPTVTDSVTQNAAVQAPGATLTGPIGDIGVVGILDVGETWTYAASYAVTQANIDDGNTLVNTFTFDPSNATAKSDNASTAITQSPQLQIVKTHSFQIDANGDGQADVGDVIAYLYTVTNSGNTTITGVQINDTHAGTGTPPVPSGETLLSDVVPGGDSSDATPNDGVWTLLAPGDVVGFTATYTVVQGDLDQFQ